MAAKLETGIDRFILCSSCSVARLSILCLSFLVSEIFASSLAPIAESWVSATNLVNGRSLLGWEPSYTNTRESLQLCFSVDQAPATFCSPATPVVQTLPFPLDPGGHTLHVTTILANGDAAGAPLALPLFVNDKEGADPALPRVLFTTPAFGSRIEITEGLVSAEPGSVVSGGCELAFVVVGGDGVIGDPGDGSNGQIATKNLPSWATGASVVLDVAGQTAVWMAVTDTYVTLSGVELGTHAVSATVVGANGYALGPTTITLLEFVVPASDLAKLQFFPPASADSSGVVVDSYAANTFAARRASSSRQQKPAHPTLQPSATSMASKGLAAIFRQLGAASSLSSSTAGSSSAVWSRGEASSLYPIRVLFVGSRSFDGQKTIWLHQMRLLPRDRFQLAFLSFMPGEEDADNRFLSPLLRRMAELGVPASLAPLPSLSLDELYDQLKAEALQPALDPQNAHTSDKDESCTRGAGKASMCVNNNQYQHQKKVRDVWWAGARGLERGPDGAHPWSAQELDAEIAAVNHQGAVNPILLGALTRAQEAVAASSPYSSVNIDENPVEAVLAHVYPYFAQKLWRHMTDGMQKAFSLSQPPSSIPDLVVFANARDPSDQLLARAARLLNPNMQLVMDLPNLWPSNVAQLELNALVAPSTFAAEHFSVRNAVAEAHSINTAGNNKNNEPPLTVGSKSEKPVRRPPTVHVIPPGVNVTAFHPSASVATAAASRGPIGAPAYGFKRGAATPSIGFMGRLATEKSPGLFLRAAALVAQTWPSLRVVVIGDGPLRPALEALALRLNLSVDFMGGIYGEHHLAAHLTSLDIIVNPSLRAWAETFCIANAEAFASGASLVSFGVGGVGEYFRPVNTHPQHSSSSVRITHDHSYSGSDNNSCSSDSIGNGVLATTATAQSLAEGVLHVLANGALRRKMNFNARRTVLERFTIEHMVNQYADLYSDLFFGEAD